MFSRSRRLRPTFQPLGSITILLPDGEEALVHVRASARSRSLSLRFYRSGEIGLTIPSFMPADEATAWAHSKAAWLGKMRDLRARRFGAPVPTESCLPAAIELPALGDHWTVTLIPAASPVLSLKVQGAALLLSGPVDLREEVEALLRQWLVREARAAFEPWLREVAGELGMHYERLSVRLQKTRWGSCSTSGTISLNARLLFFAPEVVRYVMIHELCHTVEANHSSRFWALVERFEPDYLSLRRQLKQMAHTIPAWANG